MGRGSRSTSIWGRGDVQGAGDPLHQTSVLRRRVPLEATFDENGGSEISTVRIVSITVHALRGNFIEGVLLDR